jgi:hypothetical protein
VLFFFVFFVSIFIHVQRSINSAVDTNQTKTKKKEHTVIKIYEYIPVLLDVRMYKIKRWYGVVPSSIYIRKSGKKNEHYA